ncbi:MAG: 3'(2'),5'-bisphosphate nucleotidase [Rhodothermales bacterium]|nr:3'(2'),5'-bisphosphate nucleotidase [Rhodothermales bacterium]
MSGRYEKEKAVALQAVRQATVLCQSVQKGIEPEALSKKDRSPVTVADFGSQALVCRTIDRYFPEDPVIGEENAAMLRKSENGAIRQKVVAHVQEQIAEASEEQVLGWIDRGHSRDHSDRFWTLDPIDGTKGFLRGEQYAVALALVVAGRVDVGVLGCPNLPDPHNQSRKGVAFVAVRGEGVMTASLFEDDDGEPIQVSQIGEAAEARFCESVESGHSSHDDSARVAAKLGIARDSIRLDSQAKYAIVASGKAEIYMRLPTRADYVEKIWDHAAGMLVVEEAGGTVTDIHGLPLDFGYGGRLEANSGVVATNGHLHDEVLVALRETGVAQ